MLRRDSHICIISRKRPVNCPLRYLQTVPTLTGRLRTLWEMMVATFDPSWRIADDLTATLVDYIKENEPENIVEFGSGHSTVAMAGPGRHVTSFEQSAAYAVATINALMEENLSRYADVWLAPIENGWYQHKMVDLHLPENIDLVLIDGPGPCLGRTRAPALPKVYDRLTEEALVVLDDGRRVMEQRYVDQWMEQYPDLHVRYIDHEHGTFVISKG